MYVNEKTGQISFVPPGIEFDKTSRLWEEFLDFHKKNPNVYKCFEEQILKAVDSGREIYSISIVTEQHRWNKSFKMSNNHRAYYARLFIEQHPEHKSFFRLRPIKRV